jgi:hypothetical protein
MVIIVITIPNPGIAGLKSPANQLSTKMKSWYNTYRVTPIGAA